MTVNEKIAALRAAAKAAGADGVLLMTSDPHSSEYLPDYYNALPWFTGFTGENATLVVTPSASALWVDGRFYVQGDRQLAGTEIACMHSAGYFGEGAKAEDVKLLKSTVGQACGVKASGGIRTAEQFQEMIDAGADRIGTSAGKEIAGALQNQMKQ